MRKIKWGIIGSGKIAKRFANDLKLLDSAVLAGVTSRNPEHNHKFAAEFQTKAFATIQDLLASDAEVIYVATPHASHCEHALMAIEAGKAVLCEKPFAMDLKEALLIFERAKAKNVFVMEAMWTRFFPVIEEVISLIRNGEIGKIQSIESSIGYKAEFNPASRIFDPRLGGGSLLDVGVYNLSFARMIVDEMPEITKANFTLASTGVDEAARFTLAFPSGVTATGECSVVEVLTNEARITGSKGEIRIPQFWHPFEYSLNGNKKNFPSEGMGFQFEAEEVMTCLRNDLKESKKVSHKHTLDVMRIMDAVKAKATL